MISSEFPPRGGVYFNIFCGNSKVGGGSLKNYKKHPGGKSPWRDLQKSTHANARTFPIFVHFLCNNTKNLNRHNSNRKYLSINGRNTAEFSVFPSGAGVFLRKKIPPGLTHR